MNEALPPVPPKAATFPTGLAIAGATVVVLVAVGAASMLITKEMRALQEAKPTVPPEVSQALDKLDRGLKRQQGQMENSLSTLQADMADLKEQWSAQAPSATLEARLAVVEAKIDALGTQLAQAPAPVAEAPKEEKIETPAPVLPARETSAAVLALREAIASGEAFTAALNDARKELAPDAYETLSAHAADGVPSAEELHQQFGMLVTAQPLPGNGPAMRDATDGFAGRVNRLFGGVVKIKRQDDSAPARPATDAYADLRDHADLSIGELARRVRGLPASAREPFEQWLTQADAYRAVHAAVNEG